MKNRMSSLQNKKSTSILTHLDYARIRKNANPPEIDHSVEIERARAAATHGKTLEVTETWANSIVNERKARLTRLHREAEEREAAQKAIDDDERQYQKGKRKEALRRAERMGFEQKPEVRAVHAQLLLHEVNRERQRQLLMKERKKHIEDDREDEYAANERRKFEEGEAREQENQRERREKALEIARGVREQREEAQQRKIEEREAEKEAEALLVEDAARVLYQEKLDEIHQCELQEQHNREVAHANKEMIAYREKQAEIERVEDERITAQRYALDDEIEERKAAELNRRKTRQADIDKMTERQQETLREIHAQKGDFEDKQYQLQYEKEKKHVEELWAKDQRMLAERRAEYLDSRAKLDLEEQRKKNKVPFQPDETVLREEEAIYEREQARSRTLQDLAQFQKAQATEKKDKEAADRERRKLEFRRQLELDDQRALEAQEYAREMLLKARQRRKKQ
jgi:hypothetical protein